MTHDEATEPYHLVESLVHVLSVTHHMRDVHITFVALVATAGDQTGGRSVGLVALCSNIISLEVARRYAHRLW